MNEIEIVFEDNDILVLNKPSGITVNKSETTKDQFTVQDYLLETQPSNMTNDDESGSDDTTFYDRNGIVHRIDRDTSGLLLIAKNETAFLNLQAQFKARDVKKEYFAYVIGGNLEERFEINAPIARNPRNRVKMAVVADGRPSVTLVEKDHIFEISNVKYTAIRVFPKTGRTHQIRVHMAALNHPIVGDRLYAGSNRSEATLDIFGRLMLHAHKIAFNHPKTGDLVEFQAPIPADFAY